MEANTEYLWSEKYKYVKCPTCGEVAVIGISQILTSIPPKYRWHCKHCHSSGYLRCSEISAFEGVEPNEADKNLYEPSVHSETESIAINGDGGQMAATLNGKMVEGAAGVVIGGSADRQRKCNICGKTFVCGPCVSTGVGPDTDKYICDECASRLKKMLYGD